ncbi:hypothetical protein FRC12_001924 [Ceratobasidium sp. 428]|nr:hypothetical protein FRC12_001924 [Ceratobasidium sp. 428]
MRAAPDFATQFFKLTRSYGVKNGYTIVPMLTEPGLPEVRSAVQPGGTTTVYNNSVNVKRSNCCTVWAISGSEAVTYWQGSNFKTTRFYTIREVGSGGYWGTNHQQEVIISTTNTATNVRLYQLVSTSTQPKSSFLRTDTISVRASGSEAVKRVYFSTQVSKQEIERTYSVQLTTEAHDQGWASDPERGLWSWFELAIFSQQPEDGQIVRKGAIKYGPDQEPLTWLSHRVGLKSSFTEQSGVVFAKGHEMWKTLKPGDHIGVLACAQYGAWSLDARRGRLNFQELEDKFEV